MSEMKPDKWMSLVALATAIMAVLAAITTLYLGKYSSRAILHQGQETSQWAYYQAKSIKSYVYEIQKQKLELEMMAPASRPKAVMDRYSQLIKDYDKQIKRYDVEKAEIKTTADALAKSTQAPPPEYTDEDMETPTWAKSTIPEGMTGYNTTRKA